MPSLSHVLKVNLRQAVAVVAQKAAKRNSITKLNSRLEPKRGPVD